MLAALSRDLAIILILTLVNGFSQVRKSQSSRRVGAASNYEPRLAIGPRGKH